MAKEEGIPTDSVEFKCGNGICAKVAEATWEREQISHLTSDGVTVSTSVSEPAHVKCNLGGHCGQKYRVLVYCHVTATPSSQAGGSGQEEV